MRRSRGRRRQWPPRASPSQQRCRPQEVDADGALDPLAYAFATRTAVVDGDARFTYAEFADRSQRLAGSLGIEPGDPEAALATNSQVMLEAHDGVHGGASWSRGRDPAWPDGDSHSAARERAGRTALKRRRRVEHCRDRSEDHGVALYAAGMVEAGKQPLRVNGLAHLQTRRTALERYVGDEDVAYTRYDGIIDVAWYFTTAATEVCRNFRTAPQS